MLRIFGSKPTPTPAPAPAPAPVIGRPVATTVATVAAAKMPRPLPPLPGRPLPADPVVAGSRPLPPDSVLAGRVTTGDDCPFGPLSAAVLERGIKAQGDRKHG